MSRDSPAVVHSGRWRALAVSQIAAFMALLDVSIVNVALPSIERGLGASPATVQWVVSGYGLTFGLALIPAGRLGDILGRRRMFLIGLSAFVVTSALTGAAPTTGLLIAARLLQGVAGGVLIPQNSGLIQELFQGAERGKAFGILGTTIGLATAAGPVIGGLILAVFTGPDAWRWVFYVNVPIGLVAFLLAIRFVPRLASGTGKRTHLDLVGTVLLGCGVLSLLLPLVNAVSGGPGRLWPLLGVAPLLLFAFGRWELRCARRGRQPLLDPRLARTSGYAAGLSIGSLYFLGFTGIWLVLALYFQDGLGYSPLRSGAAVTPFALMRGMPAIVARNLAAVVGKLLPRSSARGERLAREREPAEPVVGAAGVERRRRVDRADDPSRLVELARERALGRGRQRGRRRRAQRQRRQRLGARPSRAARDPCAGRSGTAAGASSPRPRAGGPPRRCSRRRPR